ncbi:hypothetical protein HY772_03930, partial [Candidatus Woesearchaeota archaeon]|nr:hypothetical protein [Candidatus Woesearchaeota archaeon]
MTPTLDTVCFGALDTVVTPDLVFFGQTRPAAAITMGAVKGNPITKTIISLCETVYVDDSNVGSIKDGRSLATAYNTITGARNYVNANAGTNPTMPWVIVIAPGTYTETDYVRFDNVTRVWTAANNLTIKSLYADVDSMPVWKSLSIWMMLEINSEDYITIEGIQFRGNNISATNKPWGIYVKNDADNIIVRRCLFLSCGADTLCYGVNVEQGWGYTVAADSLVIENCIFYGCKIAGIQNKIATANYTFWGHKYVNNTFYKCGYAWMCDAEVIHADDFLFANNIIVSPTSGYGLYGGWNSACNLTFRHCVCNASFIK